MLIWSCTALSSYLSHVVAAYFQTGLMLANSWRPKLYRPEFVLVSCNRPPSITVGENKKHTSYLELFTPSPPTLGMVTCGNLEKYSPPPPQLEGGENMMLATQEEKF